MFSSLPSPRDRRVVRRQGLTLVETLTVLLIISILVAFVTGLARHANRAAETSRARADLVLLADSLERYYLRFGNYPDAPNVTNGVELLNVTTADPGSLSDYRLGSSLPNAFSAVDPWGTPYRYERRFTPLTGDAEDGAAQPETFRLYSLGPDRQEATHDDLSL